MMRRLMPALAIVLPVMVVPWRAAPGHAADLTFGGLISTINHTSPVVAGLSGGSPMTSYSTIDVNTLIPGNPVIPGDPCRVSPFQPGDPCRPAYFNAINRNASDILSLRDTLATVATPGEPCRSLDGGICFTPSIADSLAQQGISTNQVVTATLDGGALDVFYDSNPGSCVIIPTDPCVSTDG